MATSFDVRIWKVETRKGKTKTAYRVIWRVDRKRFSETFSTQALADSFRSDLISAARRGESFDCVQGLPQSMLRSEQDMSWFEFAQRYVDMKWPRAAGKSRSGNADALASATFAMLKSERGKPDDVTIRKALTGWAFNRKRREDPKPSEVTRAVKWLESNTRPVSALGDTATLRQVLDQISLKMDGTQAAAKTVMRKRAVLHNALDYGVELKAVDANRLSEVRWNAPKQVRAIDKRVVINPKQAVCLLAGVEAQHVDGQPRRSAGPALKAYFAVMYYAALRPEEATMLCKSDLSLPESGWGELLISHTAPITGAAWTDTGMRRDRRQLKQRAEGEVRPVPCPPPLTEILHEHLRRFGTANDGRLFRNLTGGELAESTVSRVWDKARKSALTAEEYRSPLARRPYDLRHACVSTWLGSGVPSTQCAEWAGHSVAVLHQVYAKVLAGQEDSARHRIEQALNWQPSRGNE